MTFLPLNAYAASTATSSVSSVTAPATRYEFPKNRSFTGSVRIDVYASKENPSVISRGGDAKISGFALNELDSIHSTGRPANSAPSVSATSTSAFWPVLAGGRRSSGEPARTGVGVRVAMSVTRLLVPDVEECEDHRQQQHDHRGRGRHRELVAAERELVREGAEHLGRVDRAAAGGHPDQRELLRGPDEVQQRHRDDDRAQLREGDVPELLQRRGPVHPGGLVQVLGDALQAGQQA